MVSAGADPAKEFTSQCTSRCTSGKQQKGSPCQLERFEDLPQGEVLAISEDDHLVWLLAQLALDEPQQVLLVHARAVVYVCVHLQQ